MSKAGKAWLIGSGTLLFLTLVVGTALAGSFRNRFYPNTRVGTLDLSGKSYAVGRQELHQLLQKYGAETVTVAAPDLTKPLDANSNRHPLTEVSTTAEELGVRFPEDGLLATAWAPGHGPSFGDWLRQVPARFFAKAPQAITYTVDPNAVTIFVHTDVLPKLLTPAPPKIVISTASAVTVSPAAAGLTLDETGLASRLSSALTNLTDGDPIYVQAPTALSNPGLTDAQVTPIATQLDSLGNLSLYLSAPGLSFKPSRSQLLGWFQTVQDDSGRLNLVLDQTAISKYLTAADPRIDPLKSTDAVTNMLAPLIATVPVRLSIGLVLKPGRVVAPIAGEYTLGRAAGKYIEVDLASQRLYRINGATLEKTYLISSGKASTPTPLGQFTINGHAHRAFSSLYGLYMPFWMNFKDGLYGLHELPVWPNGYREGANHLGIPVSDGCIRLGIGDAEEMYDWTADGTQLFIH